ncbi:MAG TPA: 50S ribosomal protein L20 [Candidatus Sulfotelmatobacter sp.]|jgi:large subunit ribosomal protein L20|nr:50S ribosomal protein L20 [Candidatus Sulfotelmatobacter sp.]
MARIKRGTVSRRKHNKLLGMTKGYRGTKSKLVKVAKEAALHAGQYAYHGRKLRKRDFRTLWITRIAEAVKKEDLSYSVFIDKLHKTNITLDRKILSNLIVEDPKTFKHIVDKVKSI